MQKIFSQKCCKLVRNPWYFL